MHGRAGYRGEERIRELNDRPPSEAYAWVLNLDADLELGGGPGWSPKRAVRLAMQPHVTRLAAMLLRPGDLLVTETTRAGEARGLRGRAFCPTDRALAALQQAGATPELRPSQAILRRVNSRAFSAELGVTLPGAVFARAIDDAVATIAAEPPVGRGWRVKRAFGMAGRGQRRVRAGVIAEPERAALQAAITADGGVMIEPDVAIERELGVHGFLTERRELDRGRLVEQRCDAHGQWLSTEVASDVPEVVASALSDEALRVAKALGEAGYFGPFGIDAFTYRDRRGTPCLQPRSEINARYSMGFAVGFGRSIP